MKKIMNKKTTTKLLVTLLVVTMLLPFASLPSRSYEGTWSNMGGTYAWPNSAYDYNWIAIRGQEGNARPYANIISGNLWQTYANGGLAEWHWRLRNTYGWTSSTVIQIQYIKIEDGRFNDAAVSEAQINDWFQPAAGVRCNPNSTTTQPIFSGFNVSATGKYSFRSFPVHYNSGANEATARTRYSRYTTIYYYNKAEIDQLRNDINTTWGLNPAYYTQASWNAFVEARNGAWGHTQYWAGLGSVNTDYNTTASYIFWFQANKDWFYSAYAGLQPASYNLTFDANGGSGGTGPTSTMAGAGISAPTVSRTGHTFTGWWPSVPATMPAADSTYYAQWALNNYTITFNANGGTGGWSQSLPYGSALTPPTVTRTGHTFAGWSPGVPGTVPASDATYTAQWSAGTYNVAFDANGGSGSMSAQSIPFGQSANLTANAFSRTGYTFAGWNTQADGGGDLYGNQESYTMNTEGATLYAQWSVNRYSIVFNPNGGSAVADIYDDYGTQVPTPTNPTRPGHNFVGWYADAELTDAVSWPYTLTGDVTFYAKWAVSTVTITFDANGGTGGTSGPRQPGEALTAPTVTREGYMFAGWDPTVPATVPGTSTTYTAQWVQTAVTLTRTETGFDVRIYGWAATNRYQIWSYQKVTGDVFLNATAEVPANQWIMSAPYTLGSSSAAQPDGSILFSIANFVSPDANYTVAVRIADAGGNFVRELRDSYTPEDVQEVVINKVLVDGAFSTGREFKEVKPGAAVVLTLECNDLPNLVYAASIYIGGSTLNLTPVGNQFVWDIADLTPSKYTVELEVTNGVTTAKRSIDFHLYTVANIEYGVISNMTLSAPNGALSITPTYANGTFSYRVGEPGRAPSYRSSETMSTGTITHPNTLAPGVYRVTGLTTRLGIMGTLDSFDDGIARTITVGRPGGGAKTMTLTANPGVEPEVSKGTAIRFTANASIGGASEIQYSFWRYDAKGYVLIKDWSSSNTLDWTPARIGIYTIEARAKGADAGSYEVIRSMTVNVTDTVEQIAQVENITLNTAELNGAQARRPVQLKANATSLIGENLLYKFHMEDEFLGVYQLQGYSANQNCVWTPRKPGTYTVHVLVKNEHSFGRYDAKETFEITVN